MMHGMGVMLLASVAGYWVLERASNHKGNLKRIGQVLGIAIIVLGLLGYACALGCGKRFGGMRGGGFCPFSKRAMGPPVSPIGE